MSKETRKLISGFKSFLKSDNKKKVAPLHISHPMLGAKSLMEGIELNGFSINKLNDKKSNKTHYFNDDEEDIISEIISSEFIEKEKGGIITFSTNVNALKLSKNKLLNFIKKKIKTFKNIVLKDKKINKIISKHEEVRGVTIGNFVKGRYKAADGSLYDEKSISIEIIGIEKEMLISIAEEFAKEFIQETVLVKDYSNNRIYLVKD